jgi:hypothetical protein
MKHGARLASSTCLVASVVLCLAAFFYTALVSAPAHAIRAAVTGSIASRPSSGPVGATITVSGSGWSGEQGEQISFGYLTGSKCSSRADAQLGTIQGGSFSGWFSWLQGTPMGTYTVYALLEGAAMKTSTYTVLSESGPQISNSPTVLTAGKQATIRGSNYLPAGTAVQLSWQTVNGNTDFSIASTTSDSHGSISTTCTVPTTTLPSDSYMIVATSGGGQSPPLSSSGTYTYNAPVNTPTRAPRLSPDPHPTQNTSPAATVTMLSTSIATPSVGSTATAVSQNTGTSQTPTSNTTGNTGSTTVTPRHINIFQSRNLLQIVGIAGSLALLVAILTRVLLLRRKKAHTKKMRMKMNPSVKSTSYGAMPLQNGLGSSSALGNGMPLPMNYAPITTLPVGLTSSANDGSMNPGPPRQAGHTHFAVSPPGNQSTQVPQKEIQFSPSMHLLPQPSGVNAGPVGDTSATVLTDPDLEVMKKQVHMGLFAMPR